MRGKRGSVGERASDVKGLSGSGTGSLSRAAARMGRVLLSRRYRATTFAVTSMLFMLATAWAGAVENASARTAGPAPPPSGDWEILVPVAVVNQSLRVPQGLVIAGNGSLALEGSELVLAADTGESVVTLLVNPGRNLTVRNSTIRAADGKTIRFESFGNVVAEKSTFRHLAPEAAALRGGLTSLAGALILKMARIEDSTIGLTLADAREGPAGFLLRRYLEDPGQFSGETLERLEELVEALEEAGEELEAFLHHAEAKLQEVDDAERTIAAETSVMSVGDIEGVLPPARAVLDSLPRKDGKDAKALLGMWERLVADLGAKKEALWFLASLRALLADAQAATSGDAATLLSMLPVLSADLRAFARGDEEPELDAIRALLKDAHDLAKSSKFESGVSQLVSILESRGFGELAVVQNGLDALRGVRTTANSIKGVNGIHGKLAGVSDHAEEMTEAIEEALDAARPVAGLSGAERGEVTIEGLTIAGGEVGAVFAAPPDRLEGLKVDGSRTGVLAVGDDATMLVMRNATITGAEVDLDVRGAQVLAVDSFFRRQNSVVRGAGGELTANYTVAATVLGEGGEPFSGAAVELRDRNGALVAGGTTASDGKAPVFEGTQYALTESSLDFRDPHLLVASAAGFNPSSLPVNLDSPKAVVLRLGGDVDGDQLPDGRENNLNATWLEAETYRYSDSQVASDQLADLYGSPRTVLRNDSQGRLVNGASLPCLEPGIYRLFVRAQQRPAEPAARLVVDVFSSGFKAVAGDSRPLSDAYQWYSTPTFVSRRCEVRAFVNATLPTGVSAFADEIMLLRVAGLDGSPTSVVPGTVTSPYARDTDRDNLMDSLEVRRWARWLQGEELMPARAADDRQGSNGRAARFTPGESVVVYRETVPAGDYRLAFKARAEGPGAILAISAVAAGAPLSTATATLKSTHTWTEAAAFGLGDATSVEIRASATGTAASLLDQVSLMELGDTLVDSTASGLAAETFDLTAGGSAEFAIRLPAGPAVTEAGFALDASLVPEEVPLPPGYSGSSPVTNGEFIAFIATGGTDHSIGSYAIETGELRFLFPSATPVSGLVMTGNKVVWEQELGGVPTLLMADLADPALPGAPPSPAYVSPAFAGVSRQMNPYATGDLLVWQDDRSGSFDIFLLDLTSGTERRITDDPHQNTRPAVSGTVVVWEDDRAGNRDLRILDTRPSATATGGRRDAPLTTSPADDLFPVLDDSRLAWLEAAGAGQADLWVMDLSSGEKTAVASVQVDALSRPFLSEDRLLWTTGAGTAAEVVAKRVSSGFQAQLTQDAIADSSPSTGGSVVAWSSGGSVKYQRKHITVDVGADGSVDWRLTEPLEPQTSSPDLSRAFMEASEGSADGTVPVALTSAPGAGVTVSAIRLVNGTFSSPLQGGDTDSDGLDDGLELTEFFPAGVVEAEDAFEVEEWEPSPLNMMHQNSVTLTSGSDFGVDFVTPVASGTPDHLRDIAWHPAGGYALIVGDGGTVLAYDSSQTIPLFDLGTYGIGRLDAVAFAGHGRSALFAGDNGVVIHDKVSTRTGALTCPPAGGPLPGSGFAKASHPAPPFSLGLCPPGQVIPRPEIVHDLYAYAPLGPLPWRDVGWRSAAADKAFVVGDGGRVVEFDAITGSFADRSSAASAAAGGAFDMNAVAFRTIESAGPSPRDFPKMAFDSLIGKTVMFSGRPGFNGETWLYDADTDAWSNPAPVVSPPGRAFSALAFHEAAGKTMLFGGATATSPYNADTWFYDGTGNAWSNANPAANPPARQYHAMTYDSDLGLVVLFGGWGGSYLGDTWVYDLATNRWQQRSPASAPAPRYGHSMAYDPVGHKVVLFGGWSLFSAVNSETWLYDVATNVWTRPPPPAGPSPRFTQAMVDFDSAVNRIVMHGGSYCPGGPVPCTFNGETWLYDVGANTWTNANPSPPMSARAAMGMAFDSTNRRVVMFGGDVQPPGSIGAFMSGDTFEYDAVANQWAKTTQEDRGLVVGDAGTILEFTPAGGFARVPTMAVADLLAAGWSGDSSEALIGGASGALLRYDLSTLADLSLPTDVTVSSITWRPNKGAPGCASGCPAPVSRTSRGYALIRDPGGERVVTLDPDGSVRAVDIPIGSAFNSLMWQPFNGHAVIVGGDGSMVKLVDPAGATTDSALAVHAFFDFQGEYRVSTRPPLQVRESDDSLESLGIGLPNPYDQVADVRITPAVADYVKKVVGSVVRISVTYPDGTPLPGPTGGDAVPVEMGDVLIERVVERNGALSMFVHPSAETVVQVNRETDVRIEVSVSLDRLPPALRPGVPPGSDVPPEITATGIELVRLLDVDGLKIERRRAACIQPGITPSPYLCSDSDLDGLRDGYDRFPLSNDADADGVGDYEEQNVTGTDPGRRDSDLDGLRDGVEMGKSEAGILASGLRASSPGSWAERMLHFADPLALAAIPNFDSDGAGATDPLVPDSDAYENA